MIHSFILVQRSVGPLECYVCGKAPHKSCDEFDPHDITFRAACGDEMQSCVKSFGAFQNVTGGSALIIDILKSLEMQIAE